MKREAQLLCKNLASVATITWIKWQPMCVCVTELQPGLACLGKPYNIRPAARCHPRGGPASQRTLHLCEGFLIREAPEVEGWHSSLHPF